MAAAAQATTYLTRKQREDQMRDFFRRISESERQRWVAMIEARRAGDLAMRAREEALLSA